MATRRVRMSLAQREFTVVPVPTRAGECESVSPRGPSTTATSCSSMPPVGLLPSLHLVRDRRLVDEVARRARSVAGDAVVVSSHFSAAAGRYCRRAIPLLPRASGVRFGREAARQYVSRTTLDAAHPRPTSHRRCDAGSLVHAVRQPSHSAGDGTRQSVWWLGVRSAVMTVGNAKSSSSSRVHRQRATRTAPTSATRSTSPENACARRRRGRADGCSTSSAPMRP